MEPCPAGAVTTLCTLRVGGEGPESKRPGSPSAPGLGDKGTSTHNMFDALSEEEHEDAPPTLVDPESEESEAGSESETWITDMDSWLKEMSQRTNRWSRWRKVEKSKASRRRAARALKTGSTPSGELVRGAQCKGCQGCAKATGSARALIEISVDALNGLSEEADELSLIHI